MSKRMIMVESLILVLISLRTWINYLSISLVEQSQLPNVVQTLPPLRLVFFFWLFLLELGFGEKQKWVRLKLEGDDGENSKCISDTSN